MKIIQIIPMFVLAGAERMCETLSVELKKSGHEVIVLSLYDYHSPITERLEAAGVEIRYLHKKPGFRPSMIGKIKKILAQERPDAIHTHLYVMEYAVPAAMAAGVKTRVHTVHNIARKENGTMARKLNRFFYQHCGVTPVALSDLVRDSITEEYKIPAQKVPVIFNGVDLSGYAPKEDYRASGAFKFLHIGRFTEQKNHVGLLEAFRMFHEDHRESELWLIGDGEKKAETEDLAKESGLGDSVKFLGLQSDVSSFLRDADAFLLPSLYEGIPMTLIEAMGAGLPIVASAVGGVPDMIQNEQEGLLIEPHPTALLRAMETLFSDAALRERLGKAALARSYAFSAHTMCEKYENVYRI